MYILVGQGNPEPPGHAAPSGTFLSGGAVPAILPPACAKCRPVVPLARCGTCLRAALAATQRPDRGQP